MGLDYKLQQKTCRQNEYKQLHEESIFVCLHNC
jgi:hypothetical protein